MTALDLCNRALQHLGEPPITGIDPNGTVPQRLCYMYYHPTRRMVLCSHPWEFAARQADLTATQQNPFHRVAHTMPTDLLRVRDIQPHEGAEIRNHDRTIWHRHETIHITYTADEEDLDTAPAEFIDAFTLQLALKLCIPCTNSPKQYNELRDRYNELMDSLPQT